MSHPQKSEIIAWLGKTCRDGGCPICGAPFLTANGEPNVGIYKSTITLMDIEKIEGKYKTTGKGKPSACVVCNNCGFVMLFDGTKIGLV